jgi:hypothetical protein
MASTNKTSNYKLSQYIGTDKPTYLGDYNSDMSKIDAQMKANSDAASNAASAAGSAEAVAEKASKDVANLTQSVTANSEDIAAVKVKNTQQDAAIQNANNTASSALSKATQNEQNVTDINSRNQWIQGTNIHNTGLPNYSSGSWNCGYNPLSGLLIISGQIGLSQGSTIAANTTIATLPKNISDMIASTGQRTMWSSLYLTLANGTLQVQNINIDQTGRIFSSLNLNSAQYLNIQVTLNTSAWSL